MALMTMWMDRAKMTVNLCIFVLLCLAGMALSLEYTIREELVTQTLVGDIVADTKLKDLYTQDVISSFHFDILPGKYARYFKVNETSGLLRINNTIDRDAICPQALLCKLELDLAIVRPVQFFQIIQTQVIIEDENDNAPQFSKGQITITISEGTLAGARFLLQQARDPDSGEFGIKRYELITGRDWENKFELDVTRNPDDTFDLHLVLKEKLDREIQTQYSLQLVAYDGGIPSLSGTLGIEVLVGDYNDNAPSFSRAIYNVSILENAAKFTPIVVVHASDPDEGLNGMVRYSLAAQTVEAYGDLFGINNITGEVFLNGTLDYEETDSFNLVIAAQDSGPDGLKDHAKVFVNVVDINDHKPQISVNALTTTGHVEIMENAPSGAFVAHISVQDLDKGRSGEIVCEIHDRNFQLEQLYKTEFKMTTKESFDRERVDSYGVLLECHDNGQPQLRTNKEIYVTILDDNDHGPEFSQLIYSTSILENNVIDLPILRVNATDADIGNNKEITYSLGGIANNVFKIDNKTGVISTKKVLDHEEMIDFKFTVVAQDHGTPPQSATASVKISIIDVNDEPPQFKELAYSFGTFENQPANTEIGTVEAYDRDDAPFKDFNFSLQQSHATLNTFTIDQKTGTIYSTRILDREHTDKYPIVVIARNIAPPQPSSTVNILIHVADKNDNAPTLVFPNKDNYTAQVSVYSPDGFIFAKVDAYDADLGTNAKLTYSLAKGNDEGLFGIDPVSGALSVETDLTTAIREKHELLIIVRDMGDRPKSSTGSLLVTINKTVAFAETHQLVAPGTHKTFELGYHQKIIIILGGVTAVLVLILVAAIIYVKRRQTLHAKEAYLYMQRVDMAHKIQTGTASVEVEQNPDGQSLQSDHSDVKYKERRPVLGQEVSDNHSHNGSQRNHFTLEDLQRVRHSGTKGHPMNAGNTSSMIQNGIIYPTSANQGDLEGYQLLRVMKNDRDSDSTSGCSADISNADSGHGPSDPSEEGDPHNISNGQVQIHCGPASNPHQPSVLYHKGLEKAPMSRPNSYQHPSHYTVNHGHTGTGINPGTQPPQTNIISLGPKPTNDNLRNSFHGNPPYSQRNSYQGEPPVSRMSSFQGNMPNSKRNSYQGNPPPTYQESEEHLPPPVPIRAPKTKPVVPKRTYPQPQNFTIRPPIGQPWSTRQSLNDSTDNVSDDGSSTSGSFVLEGGEDCLKSVDV